MLQSRLVLGVIAVAAVVGPLVLATTQGCASVTCEQDHDCSSGDDGGDGSTGDGAIPKHDGGDAAVGDSSGDVVQAGEAGCVAPTSLLCGTTCEDPTLPANCGSCGHVCEAGTGGTATCTAGQCGVGCSGSTPDNCSGACTNTATDPNNCGTCNNVCPGPTNADGGVAACSPGADGGPACGLACNAPTSQACGGACVNPASPTTCGSSCLVCPQPTVGSGSPICTVADGGLGTCSVQCGGATTQQCPAGSGECFALTDLNNCGSCGNKCPSPPTNGSPTCSGTSPVCGVSCASPGYHQCGTSAAPTCLPNSDPPSTDPCVLTSTFGVFVATTISGGSDTTGTGLPSAPS